ncbi:MAG: YhdH/YhfP family quinone oxidoreductase [Deltaproteobacteria bacterium]|nr:YhdH/YhfP family quinone oxidoreductase [Deltaproteobacteria bacterium]
MSGLTFKAMVVREPSKGTFTRSIENKTFDMLPPGEVLINVKYSSINFKDALSSIGNRGVTKKYPHTPGVDAAGVVTESTDSGFNPGDEVLVTGFDLGMNTSGGFAEYIRVPASWVVKLPPNLSLRESMNYGTAGFTAALSVYKLTGNGVTPDQGQVLVTGAPGGVGSIAVSILAKIGFSVTAVNGVIDEREYLLKLGAKEVIGIEEATDREGKILLKARWAGVVDTVGGPILATAVKSTQYGGTITCCGNAASHDLPLNVYPFILRGVSLLGIDSVECPTGTRHAVWRKIASDWKTDHLAEIASEVALEGVSEKIDLILQGKHRGRAIVRID